MSTWASNPVHGVLLDITGVLYESGSGNGTLIPGGVEAIAKLKSNNIPVRLVTNEACMPRNDVATKLNGHGYDIKPQDIFSPVDAVCDVLRKRSLKPHLLVHPGIVGEFSDFDQASPTCVVMGDADEGFSFKNMNEAFNVLQHMSKPILFSLGKGKYYRHNGKLQLDVGAFTSALEFACGIEAEIVGKPASDYFLSALNDIGVPPDKAIMVGDDIMSDVGGAKSCGMRGVLVRTGKYSSSAHNNSNVSPDFVADNLAHFVDVLLEHKHLWGT